MRNPDEVPEEILVLRSLLEDARAILNTPEIQDDPFDDRIEVWQERVNRYFEEFEIPPCPEGSHDDLRDN